MMSDRVLNFDPSAHTYSVNGEIVKSVTQHIEAAGLLGSAASFYTDETASRGTRIHAACADHDRTGVYHIHQTERGYVDSYVAWLSLTAPAWSHVETPHYSHILNVAGTADRIGTIGGVPVVLDLKTGAAAGWHGVQLACYDLLYRQKTSDPPRQRIGLYLQRNGRIAHSRTYAANADYTVALTLLHTVKKEEKTCR